MGVSVTDFELMNNSIGKNYVVWQMPVAKALDLGHMGYTSIVADGDLNLHWFFYHKLDDYPKIMESIINPYPQLGF